MFGPLLFALDLFGQWLQSWGDSDDRFLRDSSDLRELEQRVRDLDRRSASLMSTPSQSMFN